MSTQALLLVVTGAMLHALWNFYAKKAAGGLPFVWLFGAASLIAALPFGVNAWLEYGAQLGRIAWGAIAASAIIHIAYSLVLQKGYRAGDFSVVYPRARGAGPLFAVAGAVVFLQEAPSLAGWAGIGLVVAGIFLIAGAFDVGRSRNVLSGVLWGGLTGVLIAAYTVLDGWAVKSLGIAPVLYYVLGLGLRTLLLAPRALADTQALRDQWRANRRNIVMVGLLSPLAYLLVLFAMTQAPLSYVAPVRELSMLIGVVIAARLLNESFNRSRAAGTALMVAGVVLLAWAA